jgi:hypothetical protein
MLRVRPEFILDDRSGESLMEQLEVLARDCGFRHLDLDDEFARKADSAIAHYRQRSIQREI